MPMNPLAKPTASNLAKELYEDFPEQGWDERCIRVGAVLPGWEKLLFSYTYKCTVTIYEFDRIAPALRVVDKFPSSSARLAGRFMAELGRSPKNPWDRHGYRVRRFKTKEGGVLVLAVLRRSFTVSFFNQLTNKHNNLGRFTTFEKANSFFELVDYSTK